MTIPRDSAKTRRICIETHRKYDAMGQPYMRCQCGRGLRKSCNDKFNPAHHWLWHAHHLKLKADGGEDTPDNIVPILAECHMKKTTPEDVAQLAKSRSIRDRRSGAKKAKSPMMGSRSHPSRLRKKMNGTITKW